MKLDITQTELSVFEFRRVIQNHLVPKKIIHTRGRRWDGLIYVLNGSCKYAFEDGTAFEATVGNVFYLAKDSKYTMEIADSGYDVIFTDFLFHSTSTRKSDCYKIPNANETERLFRRMLRIFIAKEAGYKSQCLSLLYRIYASLFSSAHLPYLPSATMQKLDTARDYILKNLTQANLNVSELASQIGLSEVYLRKLFHSRYACSPSQYITNARLQYAKELMEIPDLTLEEIALQSGFSSLSYFCRVFKEHHGEAPGEFRKSIVKIERKDL